MEEVNSNIHNIGCTT